MNKILMILVPILVAGGVGGAAFLGYINIPGITPAKKKAQAAGLYGEGATAYGEKPDAPVPKPIAKAAKAKPKAAPAKSPPIDPFAGEKRLAKVWNDLETGQLLRIISDWKTPALARQLSVMRAEKVIEVLSAMEPRRASELSVELQRLGIEAAKREAAAAN